MRFTVVCAICCSLSNFACMEGHIYCKPHFMEIFMTKGETNGHVCRVILHCACCC